MVIPKEIFLSHSAENEDGGLLLAFPQGKFSWVYIAEGVFLWGTMLGYQRKL